MRPTVPAILAALACACATSEQTRRVDRSRPIEIAESSWRGTKAVQDGVPLDARDLASALAATPASSDHLRSAERRELASTGLLVAGVGLAVAAVLANDTAAAVGLSVGAVGACGGSVYFRSRASASFVDAVRAYNASLPVSPPAPSAPTGAAAHPEVGVSLAF